MKKTLVALLSLCPLVALSQPVVMRNDAAATTICPSDTGQCSLATDNKGRLFVSSSSAAATTGGGTVHRKISAATNNATNVKATPGQVYDITICNINAAVRYVKLYDKATAPTCGTDTPVMVLTAIGGATGPCNIFNSTTGLTFTLGIGYCIVTGATDADNTATAANEQFLTIGYK